MLRMDRVEIATCLLIVALACLASYASIKLTRPRPFATGTITVSVQYDHG